MKEKQTMLIMDASETHGKILAELFAENYILLPAPDGEHALEILRIAKVDVLIANFDAEHTNDAAFLRRVRELPQYANLPIAVMTTRTDATRADIIALGADECIMMPLDLVAVRSQVENLVISKKTGTSEIFSAIGEKPSGTEENLQRMMHYIPGGVIMYHWDGKKLNALYISDYYAKKYGASMLVQGTSAGRPDFRRTHPDDVEGLQRAIQTALQSTHTMSHVYRAWDDETDRYRWIKLNAVEEDPQADGSSYVYALYTDVTDEMDAKLAAEKNHETLKASISSSGQFYFEFDPKTDLMICPPEQADVFDLPATYINFPESLFEAKGILEEARPVADELMEKLHRGVPEAECELRMYTKGVYLWYRFCFRAWDDPTKGYPIYLCSFGNINAQKVAEEKYTQQMETIVNSAGDALAISKINVTKNICYVGNSNSITVTALRDKGQGQLDKSLALAEAHILDAAERQKFHETFSLENLLESYKQGVSHIVLQYRFLRENSNTEWIESVIDLVQNPSTLDIEGYISARNINAKKMEEIILQRVIARDYHALIYFDRYQDDYMLFDSQTQEYFVKMQNVYTNGIELGISYACEEDKVRLRKEMTKEKILQTLAKGMEFTLFYEGADHHKRYEITLSNVRGDDRLVIGVLRDVTDETLLERLTYEIEHDPLTGLYNRKKAFEECNKMFAAHPDEVFCMVHFDIQRFRLYNSFFGDAEGDKLLIYLAGKVQQACDKSPYSVCGRIEADQYLVCIPYNGQHSMEVQKQHMRQVMLSYRNDFPLTGNNGVYLVKDRSLSAEACYSRAAIAAKSNRSARTELVKFFDDAMERQLLMEQQIGKEMQTAIEQEQFVVYLQPKYKLLTGEAYGAEALVRWQHPQHGLIPPGDFIPLFETNGFITTLDRYMWEHTCQLIHKWLMEGRKISPISVNVSRVSMYSTQTVGFLTDLIKKYEIPVKLLNLELTESAYMDSPEEMRTRLEELRAAGFEIMMDDFGSGYSSLNTLREIPVDYLKVDRIFLASVDRDTRSRLVLASVIHMASRMNIPVITEGVETDEQRDFLVSIGCDYVQGYLYAKPMPVADYEKKILERDAVILPSRKDLTAITSQITMDMNTEVQLFADLLPHAVAFVDYVGNEFSYLSANRIFQATFGMHRDTENMTELVEKHITRKNYDMLTEMYGKIATTHAPAECFISWRNNQNRVINYLVRAQYLGTSAYSTMMIATFVDLTEISKKALSMPNVTQGLLAAKDSYSLREIGGYLHMLNQSFDFARLVRPEKLQVITSDVRDEPIVMPGKCYGFWGKTERCENCPAQQCLQSHQNRYSIEKKDGAYYLLASHPVRLHLGDEESTTDYAIETMMKLSDTAVEEMHKSARAMQDERIAQLQTLLYEDPLTTAYNRRYFRDMLFLKEPEPGFEKHEGIAFVLIDLNNFKSINDAYGHSVGDQILLRIAGILQNRARRNDSVIRYGGDEFLVIYSSTTEDYVRDQVEKIESILADIRYAEDQTIPIGAAIGYSYRKHFDGGISEAQLMINEADQYMYSHKKKSGKPAQKN